MQRTLLHTRPAIAAVLVSLSVLAALATNFALADPDTHGRVRPLRQVYRTHQGWEYRTDHFIALSTTSGDDARWAGDEMEDAWQETARLADHFGNRHRRSDFGMVGAMVTSSTEVPRVTGTRFPKLAPQSNPMVVQVQLAGNQPQSREAARETLRRGGAATLLRQSGYAEKLPRWASEGLTEYVALQGDNEDAKNVAPKQASETATFRFLMAADDGAGAAALLASLAQPSFHSDTQTPRGDFAADRLERRIPIHSRWDKVTARRAEANQDEDSQPVSFPGLSQAELSQRMPRWLANPQAESLPVQSTLAADDRAAQQANEMALIVKLWHRHANEGKSGAKDSGKPLRIDQLRAQLMSPNAPPWSATDVDGRILTWRDPDRAEELLSTSHGYRTTTRDGLSILQLPESQRSTLEAWIDRDRTSNRPIVRVQRAKTGSF